MNRFEIHVFQFETDDEEERNKVLYDLLNRLIAESGLTPGLSKKILSSWKDLIYSNSSKKDPTIKISKKELAWSLIVLELEKVQEPSRLIEDFDVVVYEDAMTKYKNVVNYCSEHIDIILKIMTGYMEFNFEGKASEKIYAFITEKWGEFKDSFLVPAIDEDTVEVITKMIIYYVIAKKKTISKIKNGVGL